MKKFFKGSSWLLILLVLSVQVPVLLLLPFGNSGLALIGFLLLLLTITLWKGATAGLFWSLPYLFLLGAGLFYSQLPDTWISYDSFAIPIPYFIGYGISLIILILIAGFIRDQIEDQREKIHQLQEKVRQFVAVDTETGFDNRERMEREVTDEMKRIERYGGTFVLFFLQIEHYNEFQKLYGEKERKHLLTSLAQALQNSMRVTDRKFRYTEDSLAVLLTNTGDGSLEIINEKLRNQLKIHQLLSGGYIDLTFQIGHVLYEQQTAHCEYEELIEKVESEMVPYAV